MKSIPEHISEQGKERVHECMALRRNRDMGHQDGIKAVGLRIVLLPTQLAYEEECGTLWRASQRLNSEYFYQTRIWAEFLRTTVQNWSSLCGSIFFAPALRIRVEVDMEFPLPIA